MTNTVTKIRLPLPDTVNQFGDMIASLEVQQDTFNQFRAYNYESLYILPSAGLILALESQDRFIITPAYQKVLYRAKGIILVYTETDTEQDEIDEVRCCRSLVALHSDWYDDYYCKDTTRKLYAEFRQLVSEIGPSAAYECVQEDATKYWCKVMCEDEDKVLKVLEEVD